MSNPHQPYPPQQPWGQPPQQPKKRSTGKIVGLGCAGMAGLLILIGIVAAIASSGGGDSVTSKPNTAASAASSHGSKSAAPAKKKPATAHPGDTITVKGSEDGSKLDVTVVKVADPAKSADEFTQPGSGKRFVGVQFRLVNTGSAVYSDSPSNGAQIADSQGQQFESTFGDITAGPSMSSDVRLKPGATALGWIVFEVPKASKTATVHFTMDSGFADQTGEWKLH